MLTLLTETEKGMKLLLFIFLILTQQNTLAFEIHAHRGGSSKYSENSLKAIIEALDKGLFAAELDLHLTKDNHFVVTHDPVINVKKCESPIQNQLESLVIRELLLEEVTSFICQTKGLTLEPITSFEQVLIQSKKYKNQKLNIEIKYYRDPTEGLHNNKNDPLYPSRQHLVKNLHTLLTKYQAYKRVIIQSFSKEILVLVKAQSHEAVTSFLYSGTYLKFVPKLILKKYSKTKKLLWFPNYKEAFKIMVNEDFDYFSPKISQITSLLFRHKFRKHILNARLKNNLDFKIIPWTVNNKKKSDIYAQELDGVITDYPELWME